jgi:Putative transposase
MLRRLEYLEAGIDNAVATGYDSLLDNESELVRTMAASVAQRIAFGERARQKVRRIGSGFGSESERPELTGPRCASINGFSLHANTQVPAHRRDQLERLIRYTARGAVALEHLAEDANGDLLYSFTKPWSDDTTGVKLSPLELLEKLAAIVPLPRVHLVRYAGCLAPHSQLHGAIIPTPRQQGVGGDEANTGTPRWSWARLLGRVFAPDHGHHHPRGGDHADPPASEPCVRPTSHCSRPFSSGNIRLGRLMPTTSHVGSQATCAQRRFLEDMPPRGV